MNVEAGLTIYTRPRVVLPRLLFDRLMLSIDAYRAWVNFKL
jgi:hypothetical protein